MDIRQKLYPVKTAALDLLCKVSAGARQFDPKKNILIFGYPRSGSTWLMELIRETPGTVNLWEPLHIENVDPFRQLGFGWRQHIPETADWKEAEKTFEKLFKGEYLNFWLTSRDFPLKFCVADRMIIKFVRANAMIPWLLKKFDFELTPLFLLRHPFAIAASQMKEGSWDYEFEEYIIPNMPYNEIYKDHQRFLSTLKTKSEDIVATWCINNKVVLDEGRNGQDWITLYYESLLLNPSQEIERIFDHWNMPVPEGIMEQIREPSSTAQETTFREDIKAQLSKWRQFFDQAEISRMQRVLDYFEIDIYSDALLPKTMVEKE